MQATEWDHRLAVRADGKNRIGHAGVVLATEGRRPRRPGRRAERGVAEWQRAGLAAEDVRPVELPADVLDER